MLLGTILLVCTQAKPTSVSPVLLRLQPKVGTVCVYENIMDMNMSAPNLPANNQSTKSAMTLKILKSDGKEVKQEVKIKSDANSAMNNVITTMTLSPLGVLKNAHSNATDPMAVQAMKAMRSSLEVSPAFPVAPVSVGATWGAKVNFTKMMEAMGGGQITVTKGGIVKMEMKLAGFEQMHKHRTAIMKWVAKATMNLKVASAGTGSVVLTMSGSQNIDLPTGLLIHSVAIADMVMKMPGRDTLTMKTKNTQALKSFR